MSSRVVVILILFIIVNLFGCYFTFTSDELRVTLPNGNKLVGRYLESSSGRSIKGFLSIPYARPPVGPLRFKAPEPMGKWDDEYLAVDEAPTCPQRSIFTRSFKNVGTEDCLYLNVYAPYTFEGFVEPLPVMVFIHGGGFTSGTSNTRIENPGYFLDEDIILVTINYRLGILGFLSTEDENCPGNFGFKDKVMALKWVRDNIKQFGGDPKRVTIFGQSSGGASVTYLMASPLANGLFSKAIAHSGVSVAPWAQPSLKGVAREKAKQLAEYFNCYKPDYWSQTVDCLRNVPAENITATLYNFFKFDFDPVVAFPPVIEADSDGAFITKHPRDLLIEHPQNIPFLTGINYDEGLLKSAALFNVPGLFEKWLQKINYALPIIFYYDHFNSSVQESITKKLKEFYFENNIKKDKEKNITNLYSDGWYLSAMDSYLRLRLSHKDASPTYVYLLANEIPISLSIVFNGDPNKIYGVSHSDELIYLFPNRKLSFPLTLPTRSEVKMRNAMIQMWVDFVRTGNPTPDSSNLPKWNRVNRFPINYYRLGNLHFENKPMFGMESGLFENRAKFWRDLKLYSSSNYPTIDDPIGLLMRENSAMRATIYDWKWMICCTLCSVLSMSSML